MKTPMDDPRIKALRAKGYKFVCRGHGNVPSHLSEYHAKKMEKEILQMKHQNKKYLARALMITTSQEPIWLVMYKREDWI